MSSWSAPPGWGQRSPDGRWWFDGQSWIAVPASPKEKLIPPWILPWLVGWIVALVAACSVELALAPGALWFRYTMLIGALLATVGVGVAVGWHRHWRALPLLAAAPAFVLFLAWFAAWLIDPVAFGYFVIYSFFTAFVLAAFVYPASLAVLCAGGAVGALAQLRRRRLSG